MTLTPEHLRALEEIERAGIPGLVEVLREEGLDAIRYALWDATGLPRDYIPRLEESDCSGTERVGWEMAVRIKKILCTVLHEAHKRQVEEAMYTLTEGPENFYSTIVAYTLEITTPKVYRLPLLQLARYCPASYR